MKEIACLKKISICVHFIFLMICQGDINAYLGGKFKGRERPPPGGGRVY